MINHCELLREELRKANNLISKKHSLVRKELQKTIEVFESNIPVFPYEVCFGLLKLLAESKSSNNFHAILPFIQAIVNLGFANQSMMSEILDFIQKSRTTVSSFSSLETQTKVQQLLLLLISKQSIQFTSLAFVEKLMRLVFSLENSRNHGSLLKKNSVSSLLQVIILLIHQVRESPECADNLIKLLKQFILISDNVRPEWYDAAATPDREIATEVLSQVVQQSIFKEQPQRFEKLLISLISIMSKNLYQLVRVHYKQRKQQQSQILYFLLYCRCICRASKIINKEFQFLEELSKQLTNRENFALKVISHEAISYLFNDYHWLNALIQSKHTQSLYLLLSTELNEVKAICSDERLDLTVEENVIKHMMTSNDTDYSFLDYSHSYALKLIFKDIEQITFSLYSIYQQIFNVELDKKSKITPMPLSKVYNNCQKQVYEIVKILIGKEMAETMLQSLLKVMEKFINISGCFGDSKVCGMYIKLICKHCLPQDFRLIEHRHVQINKMVLNTANCLGNLLDTSCWMVIWKALENYESYYNKYLLSKEKNSYMQERQNDVQILYQSMDSIFTESVKYDLQYLMVIIDSLVQVTYECLENNFTDETKKIFSFERIGQIYKLNLFRCCSIWPSLSSSLLCITTSKIPYFRVSAMTLLNKLMPMTLSHLAANPQQCQAKFTTENYQRLIFEPWVNLVKCKFPELKEQIILALNKMVIDYGHILTDGWSCILEIINEIGDFKSMQVIIDTFLDKVDPYIETVLSIIHKFKSSLTDPNQKYLCLTFLWTIGDHSYKVQKIQILNKVFQILLEPEYPFVFNPEARHSSFYIFTELLIHNCSNEGFEFWGNIFSSIKTYVVYIIEELKKTTDAKIVEEAGKNILLNLVKIYKKYFLLVDRQNKEQLLQLEFFYSFCSDILKLNNTDLHVLVLKQAKELLQVKTEQSTQLAEFKNFLIGVTELYVVSTDLRMMKCLISYMPAELYQILYRCLSHIGPVFNEVYYLTEKVFLLRLEAEQKEVKLQSSRIYFQEKLILQHMKNFFSASTQQYLEPFSQKFLLTLEKLYNYEDYYYIRKLLNIAIQLIFLLPRGQLLTKYLAYLHKLALLKYNLKLLAAQTNKDLPLWHIAIQQLVRICTEWNKQARFEETIQIYQLFHQFLASNVHSKDKLIKTMNPQTLGVYFENEVFLVNYILDEFVLSPTFPQIEDQDILAFARSLYDKSKVEETESSIASFSRMNIALLFRVCQSKPDQEPVILQRLSLITLVLLQRISDAFEEYFAAQKKFGSLPVNQSTVNEVVLILNKMATLTLPPEIFFRFTEIQVTEANINWQIIGKKNCLMRNERAHLIYFHRPLSLLIRSRDPQIREALSQVFQKLGQTLASVQE